MQTRAKGERPAILLVDDVEANLVALDALLSDLDCDLVRAQSGNDALRHLLRREFAVILLDVQMPQMDGYEVARYAREHPETRHVPIIFLTAMHHTEETVLRGYGTGAVDFLFKPLNRHVVRGKVQVFLELYLNRRRLAEEVKAREKTLADLELANAALRHFTNAASHDLRAPLRVMRGFLEALEEEAGPSLDAQARDYLNRSRKASERMVSLLDSLLAYARLQRPVSWGEVDCDAVVEQVRTDLAERIATAGATLRAERLPKTRGDADRLYQLFLNLIGNALKFHRNGVAPEVVVSAETRGHETVFCVADNGIGIPVESQTAIFKAFLRLPGASAYEGSGLGLAICQQIVEQHGGRIWVTSEPGKGARLCFALGQPKP
jgi:two-component system sensor histidine kinase/response regulator